MIKKDSSLENETTPSQEGTDFMEMAHCLHALQKPQGPAHQSGVLEDESSDNVPQASLRTRTSDHPSKDYPRQKTSWELSPDSPGPKGTLEQRAGSNEPANLTHFISCYAFEKHHCNLESLRGGFQGLPVAKKPA